MATSTIFADHPYWKYAKPSVWQMANGLWTVRWRDFLTIKQDMDFETRDEAEQFAARRPKPPLTIEAEEEDLQSAHQFWMSMCANR